MVDDMDKWQLITRLISDSEEMRMSTRDQIERMGMAAVPILVRVIEADWISDAALSFARGMLRRHQASIWGGKTRRSDRGRVGERKQRCLRIGLSGAGEFWRHGHRTVA